MPDLLELDLGMSPDGPELVEVAVDAPAGPGPRTYTYAVPPELSPLEPGEAVLVPFGRGDGGARQAIGIVMGSGSAPERGGIRPVAARIRSDGPLLPPLSLALAGWIAARYLAPLAVVIRAMLPPGLLEKVELVAEVTPAGEARLALPEPGLPPVELDLLDELAGRARLVRDLGAPEGRAGLLRRLRLLETEGLVELTWTLLGAASSASAAR
jgi:primosomal protein N' (replication factor Y)